jgi:formate hydrogenlyase subunit 3/multisubunit Na+/H+ antiporter MnhD subunit
MNPDLLPWTILFLPLLAAAFITLFTQHNRKLSAGLSIGAVVAGFILSLIFVKLNNWGPARPAWTMICASWKSSLARYRAVVWRMMPDLFRL